LPLKKRSIYKAGLNTEAGSGRMLVNPRGADMKIKNRIKELRFVKASELAPNPKNWRTT